MTLNHKAARILIVDDEAGIRNLIEGILDDEGYETTQADSARSAIESVSKNVPDVVVLDIWLKESESDGLEVLEKLHAKYPRLPVIMISGHGNIQTAVQAIKNGAYDFIEKPFKSDRLLLMIQRALEFSSLQKENAQLRHMSASLLSDTDALVGRSQYVKDLRAVVDKVAKSGSRVLIRGDAGTGKSFIARLIHGLSENLDKPFVSVNCHSVNPEQFEANLIGENGHCGIFEKAHGGVLYFDEVCELSYDAQGKMLRMLQDGVYRSSVTGELESFDIRIMASTAKDVDAFVEQGLFRMDLLYRLKVVSIDLKPLCEREEDIADLIHCFSQQFAKSSDLTPIVYDDRALFALKQYEWPGNNRQLKNFVEQSMIMRSGKISDEGGRILGVDDIPMEILRGSDTSDVHGLSSSLVELPMREAREIFERDYLSFQLKRFGGNISKTARFIGMERSALHRKLKSLDVLEEVEQAS